MSALLRLREQFETAFNEDVTVEALHVVGSREAYPPEILAPPFDVAAVIWPKVELPRACNDCSTIVFRADHIEVQLCFGDEDSIKRFKALAREALNSVAQYCTPDGYKLLEKKKPHSVWHRWLQEQCREDLEHFRAFRHISKEAWFVGDVGKGPVVGAWPRQTNPKWIRLGSKPDGLWVSRFRRSVFSILSELIDRLINLGELPVGYLDLRVNYEAKTIHRPSRDLAIQVDLSRSPMLWHLFRVMYEAGKRGASPPDIKKGQADVSPDAMRQAVRQLRKKLTVLGVTVAKGKYLLIEA